MARKPNYDFERKERERLKKQKNEERAEAKKAGVTEADKDVAADPAAGEE